VLQSQEVKDEDVVDTRGDADPRNPQVDEVLRQPISRLCSTVVRCLGDKATLRLSGYL
jgi:hypothetical protein